MIRIQNGENRQGPPCACCGGRTTTLTRYVYQAGEPHAVYLAAVAESHPGQPMTLLVSLGPWGTETDPTERRVFALRMRYAQADYQTMLVDAQAITGEMAAVLGVPLQRDEALKHPLIGEIFALTHDIVDQDSELTSHLRRG